MALYATGSKLNHLKLLSGIAAVTYPFTSIDAVGWSAQYAATPGATLLNTAVTLPLPGYDNTATAVTTNWPMLVTRRVRNPGLATLDALRVGLSFPVPACTIPGITNNSTATVPPPVANWAMDFRKVIAHNADRYVAITAGHHFAKNDGRQLACVKFSATDGTHTLIKLITAQTVLSGGGFNDKLPVYGYECTFLAADWVAAGFVAGSGVIRYDFEAYPWVGTTTSVARTSDYVSRGISANLSCSPRFDIMDTTRVGALPRCYIDASTGSDTTGVWSTNDATAAASPFLTWAGAYDTTKQAAGIPAGAFLAAGYIDGCEFRFRAGTWNMFAASAVSRLVKGAIPIFTRDPAVASSSVIITINAVTPNFRMSTTAGQLDAQIPGAGFKLRDITFNRITSSIISTNSVEVHLENVVMDNGNQSAFTNTGCVQAYKNVTMSNITTSPMQIPHIYTRGCVFNGTATYFLYNFVGNYCSDMTVAYATNNSVCMGNYVTDLTSNGQGTVTHNSIIDGFLLAGNVFEMCDTVTNPTIRIGGDANIYSTNHFLEFHNTYPGYFSNGRHNSMYVDASSPTTSRDRTHTWARRDNNIYQSPNQKQDLFPTADPLRIGGWQVSFGTTNNGNFGIFGDSGAFGASPDYYGPQSNVPGSGLANSDAVLFVNPKCTTGPTVTAGVGNGDYHLQSGSAARGITAGPLFPGLGNNPGPYA